MNLRASLAGMPILEKYDLLEEIGHGGMATVYRAKDKRLGREVAVKIIHKHLRENSEVAARFTAEARAAAKLRHPNIVEVYDVSNDDDRYRYLVVELIRGTTLRKVLQEHRDMPAEVGAAIVLELCEALAHAHEAGIIHRDVKPENVLIELPGQAPAARDSSVDSAGTARSSDPGRSGRRSSRSREHVVIKLTDFGIAKMLDAQGVTATGQVLGSPAHMAPEQIEGGEVDPRTDVFALGVLMYEALVGHLPFEGKNPAQVLRKVLDGKYPPPEAERPSIGARWAKIVCGALERETSERTSSPVALADQIRTELMALGITDPAAELLSYMRDPPGYTAALVDRLVPHLLSRGEAARKVGDSPSAAADFNRALALRPQDLAILKRITSLSASRSRRAFARKAAIIFGLSVALGLLSFGVVRYFRKQSLSNAPPPGPSALPSPRPPPERTSDPDIGPEPDSSASAEPSERPPTRPHTSAVPVPSAPLTAQSAGAPAKTESRRVRFTIVPGGGTFYLDGSQREWLSNIFNLPIGPHTVRVAVPSSDCCEELQSSVIVTRPPPDAPDTIESFTLRVPLRPATVRLAGAPANAQLLCTQLGVSLFSGQSAQVKLPELQWVGTCEFRPPQADAAPKKRSVTLRAGRSNDVPWSG